MNVHVVKMATSASDSASSDVLQTLGDQPNQPTAFSFPKRDFGKKNPVSRSFQASWFKKWPWLHYDQTNDRAFCFTCMKASKLGNLKVCASKSDDAFLTRGYTNWKDACGDESGGFPSHEHSQVHMYCVGVMTKTQKDIGELLSTELEKQKAINCAYLRKEENVIFLARQGLPMRGNWISADGEGGGSELHSNFHQLLLLRAKDDPSILDIMQRKTRKYTDHHIQNELLQILALGHLRKIVADINEAGYFTLESDEVTDSSNKEQVIVCLRWVDAQFEPHEEFIGRHHVPDITTSTIVSVLKDTVLRMNLNLSMCRGQCYDGAANMKKVAAEIKSIEPRALYLHCYGHSLNLAVADTLKEIRPMADTLDHCLEICNLLKFSPRRDAIFCRLKEEMTPHVPGLRTLCPTRWTVRAASLESILQNYPTFFATWEETAEVAKQPDVKARINGVAAQMKEFFYCLMLAERLLKHCDNLSKTIQATSIPAVEAHHLSELCIEVFQRMRNDSDFDLFWQLALQTREQLHINEPVLPRQRKRTRLFGEMGTEEPFSFNDPKLYYRSIYFQCLDAAMAFIKDRFHQRDYSIYSNLEQLLIKTCSKKDYSQELKEITDLFHADFNKSELETQLQLLSVMNIETAGQTITFRDIHKHFQSLPQSQVSLVSQVSRVVQFVLLMPATNAVSERSASAMRRIKTYLRTTTTQSRLNNIMVLHIHRDLTGKVDHTAVLKEFVSANDDRRRHFGLFQEY